MLFYYLYTSIKHINSLSKYKAYSLFYGPELTFNKVLIDIISNFSYI